MGSPLNTIAPCTPIRRLRRDHSCENLFLGAGWARNTRHATRGFQGRRSACAACSPGAEEGPTPRSFARASCYRHEHASTCVRNHTQRFLLARTPGTGAPPQNGFPAGAPGVVKKDWRGRRARQGKLAPAAETELAAPDAGAAGQPRHRALADCTPTLTQGVHGGWASAPAQAPSRQFFVVHRAGP